jgi:hypothetical protein
MPRGPKRGSRRKHGTEITFDDVLLNTFEGGRVTVNDILKHFEYRVRMRLEKLRVRGVVVREGRGGAHRQFTYRLLRPDRAAKALGEKGGLTAKSEPAVAAVRCLAQAPNMRRCAQQTLAIGRHASSDAPSSLVRLTRTLA